MTLNLNSTVFLVLRRYHAHCLIKYVLYAFLYSDVVNVFASMPTFFSSGAMPLIVTLCSLLFIGCQNTKNNCFDVRLSSTHIYPFFLDLESFFSENKSSCSGFHVDCGASLPVTMEIERGKLNICYLQLITNQEVKPKFTFPIPSLVHRRDAMP